MEGEQHPAKPYHEEDEPKPPWEEDLDIWDEIEEQELSLAEKIGGVVLGLLLLLMVIALPLGVIGIIYRVSTAGKIDPHLNPLNMIFASRVVVGAARLTLLFVAGYVIISVIGLIKDKRWLTGFWPPKASEPVSKSVKTLIEERQYLDDELGLANQTIEDLQEANAGLVAEFTQLEEAYDEALDYISRIDSERNPDARDT